VPKLQFTAFVPTADFFDTMRRNQAALNLQAQFAVDPLDNGLERFLTTRRQKLPGAAATAPTRCSSSPSRRRPGWGWGSGGALGAQPEGRAGGPHGGLDDLDQLAGRPASRKRYDDESAAMSAGPR